LVYVTRVGQTVKAAGSVVWWLAMTPAEEERPRDERGAICFVPPMRIALACQVPRCHHFQLRE